MHVHTISTGIPYNADEIWHPTASVLERVCVDSREDKAYEQTHIVENILVICNSFVIQRRYSRKVSPRSSSTRSKITTHMTHLKAAAI